MASRRQRPEVPTGERLWLWAGVALNAMPLALKLNAFDADPLRDVAGLVGELGARVGRDAVLIPVLGVVLALALRKILPPTLEIAVYFYHWLWWRLRLTSRAIPRPRAPTNWLWSKQRLGDAHRKAYFDRRLEEIEIDKTDPKPFIARCFTDLFVAFIFAVALITRQGERQYGLAISWVCAWADALWPGGLFGDGVERDAWIAASTHLVLGAALTVMGVFFTRTVQRSSDPHAVDAEKSYFERQLEALSRRTPFATPVEDAEDREAERSMAEAMQAPASPAAAAPSIGDAPKPAVADPATPAPTAERSAQAPIVQPTLPKVAAPGARPASARNKWRRGKVQRWPEQAYYGFITADGVPETADEADRLFYSNLRQLAGEPPRTDEAVYFVVGDQQNPNTGNAIVVVRAGARVTLPIVDVVNFGHPRWVAFVEVGDRASNKQRLLVWNEGKPTSPIFEKSQIGRQLEVTIGERNGLIVAVDPQFVD